MATPTPPTGPDWIGIAGAIGAVAGAAAVFLAAVAAYVRLGARVGQLEITSAATAKRVEDMDNDIKALELKEAEGAAKREAMHALLEESRRDIKTILSTVARLAAQSQNNNGGGS